MNKYTLTAFTLVAVSCLAGGSYVGFVAGGYWTGQKMEKAAIAHDCASLDPSTLSFRWRLPISMDLATWRDFLEIYFSRSLI